MSPKDNSRLKIITWIVAIFMPLMFAILVAYFPIINNNSKAATEALVGIKNLEKSQAKEFENINDQINNVKTDISINKQNFRIVTDKLRDQGLLKNVVIIDRSFIENN